MTFLWPDMLWLLMAVPALVAVYIFLLRRKKKAALRYASLSMVKEAMGAGQRFRRHLPPLYVELLKVGAQSQNLPAVLTMAADYYQRISLTWTRLKSLLVYPVIVLVVSLALSVFVAVLYSRFIAEANTDFPAIFRDFGMDRPGFPDASHLTVSVWLPVALYGLITAAVLAGLSIPRWRRRLRWRAPAFKEAALAQLAASMALMLEQGCTADQALALLAQLHAGDPLRPELEQWRARLAAGQKKFSELAAGGKLVPPLFVWLVASSGEDWTAGFKQAAELFHARAIHRLEIMLYAVLPVSVLALGFLIVCQTVPMTRAFLDVMRALGGMSGDIDGGP